MFPHAFSTKTAARTAGMLSGLALLVPSATAQLTTTLVHSGFSDPVYVTAPPGDTNRLFVVEQHTGRIEIIKNGNLLPTPFLTVTGVTQGNEQGLLGLAFHPDYATNGQFYVNGTFSGGGAAGHTEVRLYSVSANPDIANIAFTTIFSENQPFSNHNGGNLQFGPDEMLYVGLGDGGSANDPGNRAQNLNVQLGKMLRMTDTGADPGDNPWSSDVDGIPDLIWSLGLRNPWRYSFDRLTGDLYIADVGQNAREEIDFQPGASTGGANYGWRCMEGTLCTGLSGCTCNVGLVLPIHDYGHGLGCSITGGYVYRGSAIPSLQGTYFFADYCAGTIWSFAYTGVVTNFTDRTAELDPQGAAAIDNPTSFGEDADGELYIVDQDGEIWKIVSDNVSAPFWSSFESPGVAGDVLALSVFDEGSGARLFAGGRFSAAGGTAARNIARWDGASWSALGTPDGVGGGGQPHVEAVTPFDDGGGIDLYVAGAFANAGAINANNIARWDGTSWTALGGGLDDTALALAVFDEDGAGANPPRLFAGGLFLRAGAAAAFGIARWNGSVWSALGGGMDGPVVALAVYDPPGPTPAGLYAGGKFALAGGMAASNVARWNGSVWSGLGSGTDGDVQSLFAFDDGSGLKLFVAGSFKTAGGIPVLRIARWDGTTWSAIGGVKQQSSPNIRTLVAFDDGQGPALFAGGRFLDIRSPGSPPPPGQGVQAHFFHHRQSDLSIVGRWDGTAWSKVGSEIGGTVRAFAQLGGQLHAAGSFQNADGQGSSRIARLQAGAWQPVASGPGMSDTVSALAFFDDGDGTELYAGGDFAAAGATTAAHVASWNGTAWSTLGEGVDDRVSALAVFDDGGGPALFAAGDFRFAGGIEANRVARWDGGAWAALGAGVDNSVHALVVHDADGPGLGPPELVVAGSFTQAGGSSASRVARWNGSAWSALGTGITGPLHALAVFDEDGAAGNPPVLFAGGDFTTAGGTPCSNLARWNGSAWSPLGAPGSGTDDVVRALCVFDDGGGEALYAGGDFATAGGVTTPFVARWNGTSWTAVGTGTNGPVNALSVHGGRLVAGGEFTKVGSLTASRIAAWNGSSWSAIGQGMDAPVLALTEPNAIELWVGGEFTLADALPASHVTRLAGSLP